MNDTKSLIKTLTQIAMAVLLVMAIPAAQAAKGGGGKISVTAASPGEALQGEELDVIVSGSGFDEGTTAKYLVSGTSDDSQIEVLSTEFVNANQLKTRIRVKEGATVIDYDIQATNLRGRRGKGTTLFSVKQSSGGGNGGGNTTLGDDYTATDGVIFINPSDVSPFDYHIIGTPAADEIYAGGGKDLIEGGSAGDHIWARGGDDEILGGGGHIYGGTGDDIIIVGDDSYNLWGGEGDDILIGEGNGGGGMSGGEGTDWLEGGDSDDWIDFSLGKLIALPDQYDVDHYDGKLGQDQLDFSSEEANVVSLFVDMALGIYEATALDPFGTPVTVSGEFFNFELIMGSRGDDVLHGDDTRNGLWSRGGNSIIYGYGGNDAIGGGEGNNVVYGGPGNDRIAMVGDGNDILFGEAGVDFLETGGGDNELHGGEGCDRYIIHRESGRTNTIMDFEPACEKIYIGPPSRHLRIEIYDVGNDTIIEFVLKRRMVGTVILKDAVLNGVTVDESNFIYQSYPDWDCSLVWCGF